MKSDKLKKYNPHQNVFSLTIKWNYIDLRFML